MTKVSQSLSGKWREVTLGEFAPFTYGKGLRTDERISSGGVPVIGSSGVVGYHDVQLTDGPTVVIGRKGTVGAIHYSPVPCYPIDTTFFITADDPDLARFRYYALMNLPLREMNSDSAVPGLNREAAHACLMQVPSDTMQREIANVLGTLDDKINSNQRMKATIESMAQALFNSWVVDFEPVRAKMEKRRTRKGPVSGLSFENFSPFPKRLVDSEVGPIPEGWEVRPLDGIAEFLNGLALQKYPANGGPTLPVLKIAQLRAGHTRGADLASVDLPHEYRVHDGDVIFSWSGSLVLDTWTGGSAALNQHLFKVTSGAYPKWFYYHWVRHHLDTFRNIAADKATTMGHIRRYHLNEALTVIPSKALLCHMDRYIAPLYDRSISLRIEARELARQRDLLLPRLLSGELEVEAV